MDIYNCNNLTNLSNLSKAISFSVWLWPHLEFARIQNCRRVCFTTLFIGFSTVQMRILGWHLNTGKSVLSIPTIDQWCYWYNSHVGYMLQPSGAGTLDVSSNGRAWMGHQKSCGFANVLECLFRECHPSSAALDNISDGQSQPVHCSKNRVSLLQKATACSWRVRCTNSITGQCWNRQNVFAWMLYSFNFDFDLIAVNLFCTVLQFHRCPAFPPLTKL